MTRARRARTRARAERALPAMLEGLARSMRSGASLRQALEDVAAYASGPLAPDLRRVVSEIRYGVGVGVALESLAQRLPGPGVVLAVSALCLGTEAGGSQARALDGVATTLRERLAVADETRSLAAQARLSSLVIGLAPLGFGLFAATTDPRTAHFLLRTAPGLAFLGAGLLLDGLGWAWMRRICRAVA
ncbi:MAG: type II secretion system F family protein [Acidimicrobiales bacterium]